VSSPNLHEILPCLVFEADVRSPPNDRRRAQFRAGWFDGRTSGQPYRGATLRRLTWRNLGYRLACYMGSHTEHAGLDALFDELAAAYNTATDPSERAQGPAHEWEPRTPEDRLLARYWEEVGGLIFTEVPLAGSQNLD